MADPDCESYDCVSALATHKGAEPEMSEIPPTELPEDFAARLVEGCADAIVYADAAGVIRFWNEGATRMFGYAPGEALGASLDLIIPERLRPRHWQGYY